MTRWRAVGRLRPEDPRHIAGFEVVGRLGAGGMGVVYLAEHPQLGSAALKFVRDGSAAEASFRARFRREVEAAERVASPRVASVLAADPDADTPWLATAFVDGPTLREAIDDVGSMRGDRLVALAVALADALAAIHRAGIVHRDLKPANILLTPETPVVIDFGIAAVREAPALTRTGMALGTPGWMAPEQVQGRRSGPATDVFAWGLVVAYAASGRPLFGTGRADALLYRVVHESPDLPTLPPPLDSLVSAALAKEPDARPDLAQVLAALTSSALEARTAIGPTLADRTAVVPTIVALGWGVDVLPARPGGRPRSVPDESPADGPAAGEPPAAAGPVAGAPAIERPGAGAPPAGGPADTSVAFWFAGEEHRDARSLAVAFQTRWDDAVDQLFRRRDPIWLGELRPFLQALGLGAADEIVAAGTGEAPAAASMARLLLALEPGIEPRVGPVWLTPDGLASAAQAVVDGRDSGDRLADIGTARILRLWRGLPGMDRAAAIDERWHAGVESFDRRVAAVSGQAGWPTPADRRRAGATLLLSAIHPDHDRPLERRLAAARRTSARRQLWWAQLAADGQRDPAAAQVAVMTADRARTLAQAERQTARAAERQRRDGERHRREGERAHRRQGRVAAAVTHPRFVPLPRAQSGVRRAWVLGVMIAGLVLYLWADSTFGDLVVAHYQVVDSGSAASADKVRTYRDAAEGTGLAVFLLLALPAVHVATRAVVERGARRGVIRAYAGAAAGLDLMLGLALIAAATLAGLVLEVGLEGAVDPEVAAPFGEDEPWAVAAALVPLGVVGVVLIVRAVWRLARVAFGRPVAGPQWPPRAVLPR
jgi:predicted Ser/Thr protein kinase